MIDASEFEMIYCSECVNENKRGKTNKHTHLLNLKLVLAQAFLLPFLLLVLIFSYGKK